MAKKAASPKAKAKELESNNDDPKPAIEGPTQVDDGEEKENRKRKAEESDEEDEPNDQEEEDEEDGKPAAVPPKTDIDLTQPIKRARTAYFIFSDEKRAEIQAKVCGSSVEFPFFPNFKIAIPCLTHNHYYMNANQLNSTRGKESLPSHGN
jgi:hypothetical protein